MGWCVPHARFISMFDAQQIHGTVLVLSRFDDLAGGGAVAVAGFTVGATVGATGGAVTPSPHSEAAAARVAGRIARRAPRDEDRDGLKLFAAPIKARAATATRTPGADIISSGGEQPPDRNCTQG